MTLKKVKYVYKKSYEDLYPCEKYYWGGHQTNSQKKYILYTNRDFTQTPSVQRKKNETN